MNAQSPQNDEELAALPTYRSLTNRQRAVLERIDRRLPIKVIAQEMGVSETRVNQHIRALKNKYRVENLSELVELYRAERASDRAARGLSESEYSKKQVPGRSSMPDRSPRVDRGAGHVQEHASRSSGSPSRPADGGNAMVMAAQPQVVPGVLDGSHATLLRLAVIFGISLALLATVVLMVTATLALSAVFDDKAYVPEDETTSSR